MFNLPQQEKIGKPHLPIGAQQEAHAKAGAQEAKAKAAQPQEAKAKAALSQQEAKSKAGSQEAGLKAAGVGQQEKIGKQPSTQSKPPNVVQAQERSAKLQQEAQAKAKH